VTWWAWVLLWLVLVLAAAGVLYLAARRLLRKGLALAGELGAAADLLADVSRRLEDLPPADGASPDRRPPSTRGSRGRRRRGAGSQDVRWR
jgi:hypothetical protein